MPPQISAFEFDDGVNKGDAISTSCNVNKGDLPLTIEWKLNNQPISETEGVIVNLVGKRGSYLSIDSVDAVHAGTYTCHAENKAGYDMYSTTLNVNGNTIHQLTLYVSCIRFSSTSNPSV